MTRHCGFCGTFTRVFFTGKRWACADCWISKFGTPPEDPA